MSKAEAGVGNALVLPATKAKDAADPKIMFWRTARRSATVVVTVSGAIAACGFVRGNDDGSNARLVVSQQEVHSRNRRAGLAAKSFMTVVSVLLLLVPLVVRGMATKMLFMH